MYPLFESLCVQDGIICHLKWHQDRFEKAHLHFYKTPAAFKLVEGIEIPPEFSNGKVKLRIHYNQKEKALHFENYQIKQINTVKLVHSVDLDYTYKYSSRIKLEALFGQRENCDEVLIVRDKSITDSSYANVVFFDGKNGWTPKAPLLKGTCRARLLATEIIKEKALKVKDLNKFLGFKLINALRDIDQPMIPIGNLIY